MKQIERLLHLYLGCEVILSDMFAEDASEKKLTSVNIETDFANVLFESTMNALWFPICYIKPVLRPLKDITEEERSEYRKIRRQKVDDILLEANCTLYLTSKHFDLFGLIESGLAIDKTTFK